MLVLIGGTALLFALGAALAWRWGGRIAQSVRGLADAAEASPPMDGAATAAGALGHAVSAVRLHSAAAAIRQLTGAPVVPALITTTGAA